MSLKEDLTICSVTWGDKWMLDLNYELTALLHPNQDFNWVLVKNQPTPEAAPEIDTSVTPDYREYEGAYPTKDPRLVSRTRSVHHAEGLNIALKKANTRHVLILEPDFYPVRPNWIPEVVQHMKENNLAFFGTPYHPRWSHKPRYFPVAIFLMIDTEQINKESIDFMPEVDATRNITFKNKLEKAMLQLLGAPERFDLTASRDTGIQLLDQYASNSHFTNECLKPSFRHISYGSRVKNVYERILPDRFCYNPKKQDYITTAKFRDFGYKDFNAMGSEEFFWKGDPFGLHLRLQFNLKKEKMSDLTFEELADLIRTLYPKQTIKS